MHESESEVSQSCLTFTTPWIAAYQAPPSMGFSRQEYWSGLPLASLHNAAAAAAKSLQSYLTVRPHKWQPTRPPCPWDSPGKNTGVGCHFLLQGIFPTQGSNLGLLHCRQILYQLSPQGKPKNTGVGSPSLLQQIFLTQESNQGLLHCRRILYQLSYEGSPVHSYNGIISSYLKKRRVIKLSIDMGRVPRKTK